MFALTAVRANAGMRTNAGAISNITKHHRRLCTSGRSRRRVTLAQCKLAPLSEIVADWMSPIHTHGFQEAVVAQAEPWFARRPRRKNAHAEAVEPTPPEGVRLPRLSTDCPSEKIAGRSVVGASNRGDHRIRCCGEHCRAEGTLNRGYAFVKHSERKLKPCWRPRP